MTAYPQQREPETRPAVGGEPLERPVATRQPGYKQTNMPRVLLTIFLLALLAAGMVGATFFFNMTDFT